MKLCRIYYATAFEFQNLADNDTLKEVTVQICMLKFIQSNEGSLSDVRKLNKSVIDKQMSSHGPAARPTARPFGTAHGRHGTVVGMPVPARPGAPCSAWAAGLAHDTARARRLTRLLLRYSLFS